MHNLHETADEFIARKSAEQQVTAKLRSPEEGKSWVFQVEARTYVSDYSKMVYVMERLSGGWITGDQGFTVKRNSASRSRQLFALYC